MHQLVLGRRRAKSRVKSQVEFEHIDTRLPQDTKITSLGMLSDQRFYPRNRDVCVLSAWCLASLHHPVHLEQGRFYRDIRIEATPARRDNIGGGRRGGGHPLPLAGQVGIVFYSQVGGRGKVGGGRSPFPPTASRRRGGGGSGTRVARVPH